MLVYREASLNFPVSGKKSGKVREGESMMEIRYDKSNGELKLPKNIRQIGKTQGQAKIYVEDYVITFLNQLAGESPMESKLAILLGYTVNKEDADYIFIHGAIEAAGVNIQEDHIGFTSGIWSKIYEDIKTYFGDVKVAGWFLTRPGKALKVTDKIRKIHTDNFPGENKTLFVIDPLDNEETFYIYKKGELVRQEGYCIYYERNEEMQNYMIDNKNQHEANNIMNQVFIEDVLEEDIQQEEDLAKSWSRLPKLQNFSKKKSGKKNVANKLMSKMTRIAAMFVLLLVAAVAVAAVQTRDSDIWPVFGNLTSKGEQDTVYDSEIQTIGESDTNSGSQSASESETIDQTPDGQAVYNGGDDTLYTGSDENASAQVFVKAGNSYLIQDGDTLAAISQRFYNDYAHIEEICRLNDIEDANTIFPGMTIILP